MLLMITSPVTLLCYFIMFSFLVYLLLNVGLKNRIIERIDGTLTDRKWIN